MLWAGALLLTTATAAATPASLNASTYDEAACADAEPSALVTLAPPVTDGRDGSIDCSEAPAPATLPVVLDCNDERASVFVAEMIGSCDMPKTSNVAPAILKAASSQKLCSGFNCNYDSNPLRAAARALDSTQTIGACAPSFEISLSASPLVERTERALVSTPPVRIDRPPRAAA